MADRPQPVGNYEVLKDWEDARTSIRVIAMEGEPERIARHVHQRSEQVYLVLEGEVEIQKGESVLQLGPYDVAVIPIGVPHGARPVGSRAVIANISVPPLAADDQRPV
jgi:mannose-6-phosphate isomerase-like protein (cupin superfamily)